MSEISIPRAQWSEFLQRFGQAHRGLVVTLERYDAERILIDPNLNTCVSTQQLRLEGLRVDGNRISILSDGAAPSIGTPLHIILHDGQRGGDSVEVQSTDGLTTFLRCPSPLGTARWDGYEPLLQMA